MTNPLSDFTVWDSVQMDWLDVANMPVKPEGYYHVGDVVTSTDGSRYKITAQDGLGWTGAVGQDWVEMPPLERYPYRVKLLSPK